MWEKDYKISLLVKNGLFYTPKLTNIVRNEVKELGVTKLEIEN